MLTAANISVQYGDRVLMDKINLVVKSKDRIGLVGRNGAGKSTLLKIIAREKTPDEGQIDRPSDSTLGFLHQEMDIPKGKTVLDETLSAFAEVKKLEAKIEKINEQLGERTDYESDGYTQLITQLSDATEEFQMMGGATMEADAQRVLMGLGFKSSDLSRLTDEFSGGWQMRIELTKMLLQKPSYLLLDEPTNHLDIESIIWLEEFLKDYHGAIIVISHDRSFLNNITNRTVEIELGRLTDYASSYDQYLIDRVERRQILQAAADNQNKLIAEKQKTINRFMAKATKTKMAQSMQKQLNKMEIIEINPEDNSAFNINFAPAPRSGDIAVEVKNLSKSYDELEVLKSVDLQIERGDRVAFIGQNGQGKTTLAKIIVDKLKATSGDVKLGHNVSIGYYAQNQADTLSGDLTLLETMESHSPPDMRTKLRSILGAFLFSGDDAGKKVSVLSGGERARLALACMLLRPFNLLVLDEPTNHLDIVSKDILKEAILKFDGTMLVVSHDRDFLNDLTTRTIEFRDHKLYEYLGDVQFFLEKRKLDNMRQVEQRDVVKGKKEAKKDLSQEERKQKKALQREVQNCERKIEKLEDKISKMEAAMADPEFYTTPGSNKKIEEFKALKNELDAVMEKWEVAQEKFDTF